MLTLACKLYLSEPKPAACDKLFRYVIDMARYDMDFDIRDRARMMRGILLGGSSPMVRDKAEDIFLSGRVAPEFEAPSKGKSQFVINTLSHMVSHQVTPPTSGSAANGGAAALCNTVGNARSCCV